MKARLREFAVELRFPLLLWCIHRLGVLLVSTLSLHIAPQLARPVGRTVFPGFEHLCLWDCGWYTGIARDGYHTVQQAAFWPLFAWMGRALHWVTGLKHNHALIIVANVVGLFALYVVYRVFKQIEGERVARVALTLLIFWPFSFFQATGLAESTMMWLSALTLWWAMSQRYFGAGVALGLGILARHLTGFAGLGIVVEVLRQAEPRQWPRLLVRHLPALIVPFVIATAYPFLLWRAFGDPLAFVKARSLWGQWAYMSVWDHFTRTREPQVDVAILFSVILIGGAVALLFRRRWWTLAAYAVPLTAAVWLVNVASLGRYAASAWPVFLPLAVWVARRPALEAPVVGFFAMIQAMLVYLFVHNYPIN